MFFICLNFRILGLKISGGFRVLRVLEFFHFFRTFGFRVLRGLLLGFVKKIFAEFCGFF